MKRLIYFFLGLLIPMVSVSCSKDSGEMTYIGCEINGEKFWNESETACLVSIDVDNDYMPHIKVQDFIKFSADDPLPGTTSLYRVELSNHKVFGNKKLFAHFSVAWRDKDDNYGQKIPLQTSNEFTDQNTNNAYIIIGQYTPVSGHIIVEGFSMNKTSSRFVARFEYEGVDSSGNPISIRNGRITGKGNSRYPNQAEMSCGSLK